MLYTVKELTEAKIKIQRSEFISFLHPVEDSAKAQEILKAHQAAYQNATHNCYAYVLGFGQETQYYSDAGEPAGKAGKPILNSLLRNDLSGVLAIVTRYYGGIKLGVKGLIDAYTQSTQAAIDLAEKLEYEEYLNYSVSTDYNFLDSFRHQMQGFGAVELEAVYEELIRLKIKVPSAAEGDWEEFLDGLKGGKRLDFQKE